MKNLKRALLDRKISIKEFADFLGVCEKTARNKLDGETEFTYSEFKKICKLLFPTYNPEYLFDETA